MNGLQRVIAYARSYTGNESGSLSKSSGKLQRPDRRLQLLVGVGWFLRKS